MTTKMPYGYKVKLSLMAEQAAALHATQTLTKYQRMKVPFRIRFQLFIKFVIPGYVRYGKAVEKEYKGLPKND